MCYTLLVFNFFRSKYLFIGTLGQQNTSHITCLAFVGELYSIVISKIVLITLNIYKIWNKVIKKLPHEISIYILVLEGFLQNIKISMTC